MSDDTGLELRSKITAGGELQLTLEPVAVPEPKGNQIVIRVEAAPINPSDLGLLLGSADIATARSAGTAGAPKLVADVPANRLGAMAPRLDQSLPVGNEGAGVVVKAGPEAQDYLGKTVALFGGAMYAQHRTVKASDVLVLPPGATAAQGASCFVNPLTALAMVGAMKLEGHTALVHTAAASNLGQMLVKICLKDGIELVNIVRSDEQVKILRDIGAKHVVNSTAPSYRQDLVEALVATGATIAFDATGGGKLASDILSGMEAALNRKGGDFNRYGSSTHKQVYIYGGLDLGPTVIERNFGFAFSVGGFLLMPFLQKVGPQEAQAMRERVLAELTTTFASHYTAEISLSEVLDPKTLVAIAKKATGEKYLVIPSRG